MTWPPCGQADCPVAEPAPGLLRHLRMVTLDPGGQWWRGSRHPAASLAPDRTGNTRFAPLEGARHGYFGATRTVALLESALHEASGPEPTIFVAKLASYAIRGVTLTSTLRLADLRDPELERLGVHRPALVDTTPQHYPCTRMWAARLHGRHAGPHRLQGILWHSRQADLHRRAQSGGLLADVLVHTPAEVGVVWHPPGPAKPFAAVGDPEPLVVDGAPSRLATELSAAIGVPIE